MRRRRDDCHRHTLFEWMGVAGLMAAVVRFLADVRGHRRRLRAAEVDDVAPAKLGKKARKKAKKARQKAAKLRPLSH